MTSISAVSGPRLAMHMRRKRVNTVALTLAFGAMVFGVFWLVWILFETIVLGAGGMSWALLTQSQPGPNSEGGGLSNAIFGSLAMVGFATLIGTPIGVFSGIYLAEYGQKGWLGSTTRFINDILLSAPSIVIGLFVYALIVVPMKSFSGWAGSIALAMIVIPVVIRTTESMLNLVPHALREAAYALGTPKWKVISSVTLRAARSGVITGVLLAIARISGETAPLLFTILTVEQTNSNLFSGPDTALPFQIFSNAQSAYTGAEARAWGAALTLVAITFILMIVARIITALFTRNTR